MVTPTCCAPSEAGSRRYSRPCPPYSFTYSDRRHHFSSHDNRPVMMTDREESDQPRKRIAVAVSSTERHLKDSDYTYNLEAARLAHHGAGAVSPLTSLPQYAHDVAAGDGLTPYRQSPYPYSGTGSTRNYYSTSTMPGWSSTYADDSTGNVEYSYYSSYPLMSPEPTSVVPGYSQYSARRPVYADPEAAPYPYANLAHRPTVSSDSQGFSLSSIAASLPSASDRIHSNINRTLTSSSSYRSDSLPAQYANTKTSSAAPDIAYSNLQPAAFESPYNPANGTLASPITHHRPSSHAEVNPYPSTAATADQLYSDRSAEDTAGLGYIYGDSNNSNKMSGSSSSQRDTGTSHHSSRDVSVSGAGSLLANGHVYVPESHSAHPTPHPYIVPSTTSSRATVDTSPPSVPASGARGGSSGNNGSHRSSDSQRRSVGTLRGG
ncbi:hypothetical protein F5B22DRAFT_639327 [Xylaria bambusicola]|uniref:uncharacterized protein n=1 Tax=Xylaria bambusicola TaxID=326684 RepID=UPI00200802D8|nr:uncharacterized protein F5B22DRAFT_639327 [Xylaria bambusicola]KAI0506324.1 hypothetical protein F5B22DRAFT_639327 [Xylaria bambusicola]